jgi:tagaturonate reductase
MILSYQTLGKTHNPEIVPSPAIAGLPEKVLQFGTGVLLRGLPDYFIDKANRNGLFNGRVVVVKSTDTGSASAFDEQDGLYTHVVRGIDDGEKVDEVFVNASISRVLSAGKEWAEVLKCAYNPEMKVIISNTTEVGIQLDKDDRIGFEPPHSFPGKLLSFLHERFKACKGSEEGGMVIVPTELIIDNGKKLLAIVTELAHINELGEGFINWLASANRFCNSLVDRIVPGKPDAGVISEMEEKLGYQDNLLIVSEVYRLWAIEGNEKVKEVLSFAQADSGVIIAPDIEIFRELKLRLLNGTHTLSCGIAFLSGVGTVKSAMDNEALSSFISSLMKEEIAPAIPYVIPEQEKLDFASKVLDRFRNPHIEHLWHAITAQFTAKLNMRIVPVLLNHYKTTPAVPEHIALGFAAWLLFMKSVKKSDNRYFGELNGKEYLVNDDSAGALYDLWQQYAPSEIAAKTLSDSRLWDTDLTALPGFSDAVNAKLEQLLSEGALSTLKKFQSSVSARI